MGVGKVSPYRMGVVVINAGFFFLTLSVAFFMHSKTNGCNGVSFENKNNKINKNNTYVNSYTNQWKIDNR